MTEVDILTSPQMSGSFDAFSRTTGKLSGEQPRYDNDAMNFYNAKLAQSHLPWYLRPSYNSDTLKVDPEGRIRAGTLSALVERLTVDPPSKQHFPIAVVVYEVEDDLCRRHGAGDPLPKHLPYDIPELYYARKTL